MQAALRHPCYMLLCCNLHFQKTEAETESSKMEHFKAPAKQEHTSAIPDHIKATEYNIKWDYFEIKLITGT